MNEQTEVYIREQVRNMRVKPSRFADTIEKDLFEETGESVVITDYVWDHRDDGTRGPAFVVGVILSLTLETFERGDPQLHVCAVQMPHSGTPSRAELKVMVDDWNDVHQDELGGLADLAGGALPCVFGVVLNNEEEDDGDD